MLHNSEAEGRYNEPLWHCVPIYSLLPIGNISNSPNVTGR